MRPTCPKCGGVVEGGYGKAAGGGVGFYYLCVNENCAWIDPDAQPMEDLDAELARDGCDYSPSVLVHDRGRTTK